MNAPATRPTEGSSALPQLPLSQPRHSGRRAGRGRVRHPLTAGHGAEVDVLRADAFAAFAGVLFRYSRANTVTFGYLTSDGDLLGVTVAADADTTLAEWRKRTEGAHRLAMAEGLNNRDEVAGRLGIGANDVAEVLRRAAFVHDGPPDVAADVAVWVQTTATGPALIVDFDAELLDEAAVERLAVHVDTLLGQTRDALTSPLVDTELLSVGDRELLGGFNATVVAYPSEVTLVSLFDAQAAATPDAPALVFDGTTVSYAQLAARANQLAWWLRDQGVTTDTLVGVFMHRSIDMVIALYAIITAGGAYVPLDPDYPDDRLGFMIDEAAMPVVLTQDHLRDRLTTLTTSAGLDATIATLDRDPVAAGHRTDPPPATAGPDDLAYVIYTSGSTGRPKGVMNTHRGICNRLLWMQDHYQLDTHDRVLQKTPFSFDVSVWEFFWPLQVGARLVIAAPDGHRDAGYLIDTITRHHITTIHFVPSMLRLFLDHDAAAAATSLHRVICSGEALTSDLRDRFFDHLSCELHNLYGPTEAAVDVTAWQCHPDDDDPVVPIGRPIANTTIHILDAHGHPTPIGVPGELHIGGVQVARGYLHRPDLTRERFIDDPFDPDPAARLYKTGDLARWLPDGTIDFLGRLDFQVKLHGVRIELGEIEATLGTHPNIRDATVILHTDDRGHQRLVAHVASRSGHTPPTGLHDYLATTLPEHMVPNVYVTHDALPLTASGKVDRNALTAQSLPRTDDGDREPPRTPVERFIADVWAEILGMRSVGVHQRFFDLGGNSLQAAEFVNRMQHELGAFIYVVTVFSAPTVADYAAFLERQYPDALRKRFDLAEPHGDTARHTAPPRLDDAVLTRVQRIVPSLAPFSSWNDGSANPRAAFILSPPRSGTTLLRVMLAGHPALFAAPELQLLCFDTLEQRAAAFSGRFSAWLEGTVRTVMELDGTDADGAKARIDAHRRAGMTAKAMYAELQYRIGDMLLIDKSPSYALDPAVLRNAEDGFVEPVYIHLVRDPVSMIRSFQSYHMDQILWLDDHDVPARLLAEAVWTLSHRNIVDLLATVPSHRWLRVRFEDLVSRPHEVMRDIARTLGVEYDERLVDPYTDLESKMVDGIFDASTPMGDTRLLERRRIDPTVAQQWHDDARFELGAPTIELAQAFGYGDGHGRPGSGADTRRQFASRARARRARARRDRAT
jgi:amino acid adenylation domain-containing protein